MSNVERSIEGNVLMQDLTPPLRATAEVRATLLDLTLRFPRATAQHAELAANDIRVIDESRDEDEIFKQAYSFLHDAQRICFLGFGFDETNIRRLQIKKLIHEIKERQNSEPQIYATTYGL